MTSTIPDRRCTGRAENPWISQTPCCVTSWNVEQSTQTAFVIQLKCAGVHLRFFRKNLKLTARRSRAGHVFQIKVLMSRDQYEAHSHAGADGLTAGASVCACSPKCARSQSAGGLTAVSRGWFSG